MGDRAVSFEAAGRDTDYTATGLGTLTIPKGFGVGGSDFYLRSQKRKVPSGSG